MFCTNMCVLFVFITWVARLSGALAPWVLPVRPASFLYVVVIVVLMYLGLTNKLID